MVSNTLYSKLKDLWKEIREYAKRNNRKAWVFPKRRDLGANGFYGTQNIIFVGLNPSFGTFPSNKDKRLYGLLKKKGLDNIHMTDFIKIRAKNSEVKELLCDKVLLKEQTQFLQKEINLLNPKVIISVGCDCDNLIKEFLPNINCKVEKIKHYACRFPDEDTVFNEISKRLDQIINE